MTDQNQALADDIAFMRALAEEGARSPMAGGSILMSAGLIFGVCALANWYAFTHAVSGALMPVLWFGGTALFFVVLFAVKGRIPAKTASNRAAGLVWAGAGWAVFAVAISLMIMAYRAKAWWIMGAMCPMVLATYGAAWTVAGLIFGRLWIRMVGLAAFAMALVCAWCALDLPRLFLIYAISLFGLVALPGYIVMRQARQAA